MTIIQAVSLGVVQGVTEFLPISSSGHLILLPAFLGWELQSLAFDVALHLGTLLAIVVYFFPRLLQILKNTRLVRSIIVGTIPAGLVGLFFGESIETVLRSPAVVVFNLIAVAVVMLFIENIFKGEKDLTGITVLDGLVVGVLQSLALVPGVSRSGITILGGISRRIKSEEAAEFSFLLGIPAIAGAGVFKLGDVLVGGGDVSYSVLMTGIATSLVAGLMTIHLLLRFLKSHSLKIFAFYRIMIGLLVYFLLVR